MGTSMAVYYANLFLNKFETEMLLEFEKEFGVKPLVWMRYIDNIFFIWDAGENSLKKFIKFCDSYSRLKGMKSDIRFESNVSPETVNFLDVNVQLINNKLKTTLHTKATDAHLYLNAKSCHPNHVIRNIDKYIYIRYK